MARRLLETWLAGLVDPDGTAGEVFLQPMLVGFCAFVLAAASAFERVFL